MLRPYRWVFTGWLSVAMFPATVLLLQEIESAAPMRIPSPPLVTVDHTRGEWPAAPCVLGGGSRPVIAVVDEDDLDRPCSQCTADAVEQGRDIPDLITGRDDDREVRAYRRIALGGRVVSEFTGPSPAGARFDGSGVHPEPRVRRRHSASPPRSFGPRRDGRSW